MESLSEEILTYALETAMKNPEMRRKVEHFSSLFTDREVSGAETAVWWINYVMRHNGTEFLRPYSLELYWFQYLGVDLVVFHILLLILPLLFLYRQIKSSIMSKSRSLNNSLKDGTKYMSRKAHLPFSSLSEDSASALNRLKGQ